jgi:hypothetical protein
VTYNFQIERKKIKLLTEYKNVTPKVLFDNALLVAYGVPARWYTPQLALIVPEFLDMHFPGRCVGRDGRNPWVTSPHDIMPLDFFV